MLGIDSLALVVSSGTGYRQDGDLLRFLVTIRDVTVVRVVDLCVYVCVSQADVKLTNRY